MWIGSRLTWQCQFYNHCFSYNRDVVQLGPYDPTIRQAFLALADDQPSVALFLQPLVGVDETTLVVVGK